MPDKFSWVDGVRVDERGVLRLFLVIQAGLVAAFVLGVFVGLVVGG